jgi:hypothetical protein
MIRSSHFLQPDVVCTRGLVIRWWFYTYYCGHNIVSTALFFLFSNFWRSDKVMILYILLSRNKVMILDILLCPILFIHPSLYKGVHYLWLDTFVFLLIQCQFHCMNTFMIVLPLMFFNNELQVGILFSAPWW